MNPAINEKVLQFESFVNDVLKEDLVKLEQKLNTKNADIAEFIQLKSIITTLQNNQFDKNGFKTQVNVGQNFFIEAHVPDASTILLDIGLGHYLELSLNDALAVINVRIKLFEQQIANLRKQIARTNAHIKLILLGIGELQGINTTNVFILMSDWQSIPCAERHKEFLEKLIATLIDCIFESVSRENPVSRWREPARLRDIINFELQETPQNQDSLLETAAKVFKYSVKTGHPYFMNQLFSGLDPYGLAGQWLTDALNSSLYTYEVAPVLTLMEKTVITKLLNMFYKDENGGSIGDGLFCPGGSFANGIAINLARFWSRKRAQHSQNALSSSFVLFTSEDAHYSLLKWGNVCDIEVVLIRTDEYGRMDVNDLRDNILKKRDQGCHPFSVSATAGTTVLGAFDPLIEIADICEEFGMWLHVDAAWGGGLIFSKKHSVLLRGIQRADSILFNPHKLLAVPQQCSLLLSKHKSIFQEAHSKQAPYLFQKDKFYPTDLDVGDKYLQCGRRPDVLKFWFMWQAKGSIGFEKHVDHLMTLSTLFKEEVGKRDGFELVTDSCFINVCFWYIPPSLRLRNQLYNYEKQLNDVAPKLKEKMTKRGSLMINYQPLHNKPNFFRFVVQNSGVSPQDIYYVFDELENLGESM